MKQKLSLMTFILGLVLVVISFALRESYEKEMYQLYIDQQKDNLVKGWTKSWQDYLVLNYKIEKDFNAVSLKVNRNGSLIDKDFFPKYSIGSWNGFESLKKEKKIEYLKSKLSEKGSFNRAIAIKRLKALDKDYKFSDLSLYEKTLVDQDIKNAVSLIFDQIKKRSDYSDVKANLSFDHVLMNADKEGIITLIVPSFDFLKNNLFLEFKKNSNVTEIELTDNPFIIQIKKGFNPFKFNSVREKGLMIFGFILLFVAVGLYLLELKTRRLEVLKKVSFLNQLVHEVKTPITAIKLNSELLLKYGHDEELVNALKNSSNRLNDFFEDIVLINKGDKSLNLELLSGEDFYSFINDLLVEFKNNIEFESSVSTSVKIDKGRLRVVLRNLLKNAIRYGKNGSLNIDLKNQKLTFRIQDKGPGISVQDSSKIFEEFYRAKSAKNVSPDGLGIGLSIVKNLVTQMNGEIELLNPGEENALFELRIDHES